MTGIRNRNKNTLNYDDINDTTIPLSESKNKDKLKPSSISKFKDEKSGLYYNYEDRLSKMKLFKTSILMLILCIIVLSFSYEIYLFLSNILFDLYWHHIRGVRSGSDPNFIKELWLKNTLDGLAIIIKMIVSFWIFKYINKKLLLEYDDVDELKEFS